LLSSPYHTLLSEYHCHITKSLTHEHGAFLTPSAKREQFTIFLNSQLSDNEIMRPGGVGSSHLLTRVISLNFCGSWSVVLASWHGEKSPPSLYNAAPISFVALQGG